MLPSVCLSNCLPSRGPSGGIHREEDLSSWMKGNGFHPSDQGRGGHGGYNIAGIGLIRHVPNFVKVGWLET